MPLILPTNSIKASGYNVSNSIRFTRNDDGYMSRTFGTPTNRKKFTISFWLKRTSITISGGMALFGSDGGNTSTFATLHFNPHDDLCVGAANGGSDVLNLQTDRKFRDVTAWYHICLIVDSTQATDTNRVKLFVNGIQETSFSSNTYPSQNEEFLFNQGSKVHSIGKFPYGVSVLSIDGYISEFFFIDGTANAVTDFIEFDEDTPTVVKPKDCKDDLTFGNNGFYLDFADNGDLGDDESGNGNDFTETNVTTQDQCTDVPTNNFAVANILQQGTDITYNENNLQINIGTTGQYGTQSSFGMTAGKWYMEVKYISTTSAGNDRVMLGITGNPSHLAQCGAADSTEGYVGSSQDTTSYGYYKDGNKYHNSGATSYGDTWTLNDIIGMYLDLDNNKLYFSKNGVVQNSGTGIDITAVTSTVAGAYFFAFTDTSSYGGGVQVNFGGASCYTFSSIVSDAKGYGSFEYSPSGTFDSASKDFLSLCTKNLASDGG